MQKIDPSTMKNIISSFKEDFNKPKVAGPPMMDYGQEIKRRQQIQEMRSHNTTSLYIAHLSQNYIPPQPNSATNNIQDLYYQEQKRQKEEIFKYLLSLGYSTQLANLALQNPNVRDNHTALDFLQSMNGF